MKTTLKEITPQWASQILETRNPNNRKLSERTVNKYAGDILTGNWCLTHQGIAFSSTGDLLDGQHRLAAIVKARKPVQMMVTAGVPATFKNNGHDTSVFGAIDGVRPRTAATTLELLRFKNSTLVASVARSVAIAATGDGNIAMSGPVAEQIVRLCGGSIERVASLSTGSRIVNMRAAILSVIAFYHTKHPQVAEAFLIEAQTVTGKTGSPTRALSKWVSRSNIGGGSMALNQIYVASSALFHHTKGNSVEKLYGSDESVRWVMGVNSALRESVSNLFKK